MMALLVFLSMVLAGGALGWHFSIRTLLKAFGALFALLLLGFFLSALAGAEKLTFLMGVLMMALPFLAGEALVGAWLAGRFRDRSSGRSR